MTNQKENGPAGDEAAQKVKAWTYRDSIAAHRRRARSAARLEPIQCSGCNAWIRDPLAHRCLPPQRWEPPKPPSCGCYKPDEHGHNNWTCTRLGKLTPPRIGPGSRHR